MTADKDQRPHKHRSEKPLEHRLRKMRDQSMKPPIASRKDENGRYKENAVLDCGWGRLLFGQTFSNNQDLVDRMSEEGPGRRDIAVYIRDPHVLLSLAPQQIFLDPSHTYRLDLSTYRPGQSGPRGFFVRRLTSEQDAEAVNIIYSARHMVPVQPSYFWSKRDSRAITTFIAEEDGTGTIIGTVMGVDHARAFDDPERGASLWCLAVGPQARAGGIGEALVRRVVEHFKARGSAYLDLSVLHDNEQAIALYDKLGFKRLPVFSVKRKNVINEKLFAGPLEAYDALNPYARIIVDEARRRGIDTEITDAEGGFFRLSYGGRSIHCRESLSELTSAVAMSICDDKAVTKRLLQSKSIKVAAEKIADDDIESLKAFLSEQQRLVVKPARGEQGQGVAVGLDTLEDVVAAIDKARKLCNQVLIEAYHEGEDLRLVVIDYRVVAASIRKPPMIVGDGTNSIRKLIERQSRRRAAATDGESRIPIDMETERFVKKAGYALEDVLEKGKELTVRKTANLHTGGSLHDVTSLVHPRLIEAAVKAARAIDIPVVGIDFIVKNPTEPDYVFIEANERPGLANHEPQPTAERFIDLLFPLSRPEPVKKLGQARQG